MKKFNDIMGQWYLVATTNEIRYFQTFRNCETLTFFRHDLEYFEKVSVNEGNQTYNMVDNKISVFDTNSNTFVTNNKKYSYTIFKKPSINNNARLLHIANLANSTETYVYTEYNFLSSYTEYTVNYNIDDFIQKYYTNLSPISLSCYFD